MASTPVEVEISCNGTFSTIAMTDLIIFRHASLHTVTLCLVAPICIIKIRLDSVSSASSLNF